MTRRASRVFWGRRPESVQAVASRWRQTLEQVEFLLPEAHEVARREALEPARAGIRIVKAELGSDAGLIGAGLLAFEAIAKEG